MKSSRAKRQRLMIPSYVAPLRPEADVPATFESLSDDPLTTVLEFVGKKSYRSFGGVNKHCKEIYLLSGMKKKTFLFGYAPLSHIIDKIERVKQHERVGKGVVLYNRRDLLDWALQERKKFVLCGICYVAVKEGRIDLLEELWNNVDDDEGDKRYIFGGGECSAAHHGKLNVLKWYETKGFNICKDWCAQVAAYRGHLHIFQWLQEEKGLQLYGGLYENAIEYGQLNVMKWLREQKVPWSKRTFPYAALKEGNLNILQWLHDERCPWPENICVYERRLKPEALAWLRVNGYSDRIM